MRTSLPFATAASLALMALAGTTNIWERRVLGSTG